LESDPNVNPRELLSLSTKIAVKVKTSDLKDEERQHFGSVYENVTYLIRNEPYTRNSLFETLCGLTFKKEKICVDIV
jgi:hypothetical protein